MSYRHVIALATELGWPEVDMHVPDGGWEGVDAGRQREEGPDVEVLGAVLAVDIVLRGALGQDNGQAPAAVRRLLLEELLVVDARECREPGQMSDGQSGHRPFGWWFGHAVAPSCCFAAARDLARVSTLSDLPNLNSEYSTTSSGADGHHACRTSEANAR